MDEFVKFWGSIWERDDRTPCMSWIEEIQEELEEKIISMKEFDINDNGLDSEIKNRIKLDSASFIYKLFVGKSLDQHIWANQRW